MDTYIEHGEGPEAVTVISTGPLDITGGILSTIDMICMQVELFPQLSTAIKVRCMVPLYGQEPGM